MAMRYCRTCGKEKGEDEFWRDRSKKSGLHSQCKECHRARMRVYYLDHKGEVVERSVQWRKDNPERGAEISREYRARHPGRKASQHRLARYKISPQEYFDMLAKQGGMCAICGGHNTPGRELAIDHDHASGKVRGLLCTKCNSAIGIFKDDSGLVRKALGYLEAHQ